MPLPRANFVSRGPSSALRSRGGASPASPRSISHGGVTDDRVEARLRQRRAVHAMENIGELQLPVEEALAGRAARPPGSPSRCRPSQAAGTAERVIRQCRDQRRERRPRHVPGFGVEPARAPEVGEALPARSGAPGDGSRQRAPPWRGPVQACLRAHSECVARRDGFADERSIVTASSSGNGRWRPSHPSSVLDVRNTGARQAVAGAKVVIEEGERTVARHGGQPERQPRQLHRHRVEVDAVEAPLRDCPPETGAIHIRQIRGGHRSAADERGLVGVRQVAACRDKECSTAHRRVEHAQAQDVIRTGVEGEWRQRPSNQVLGERVAACRTCRWPSVVRHAPRPVTAQAAP